MTLFKIFSNLFKRKQETVEHFPDYKCKGICHKDMRCVDLPNHAEICTSKELVLTPETIAFLKEEINKSVDQRWKEEIEVMIKAARIDPMVRRKTCC